MKERFFKTQGAQNERLVQVIQNRLTDFVNEISNMSKDKELYEILNTIVQILDFDKQNQKVGGLKILTPQQMYSRLPIFLAQLKAGNNSQKVENEIRQLLYSLYRSKKLSKTIYKHLMNTI